MNSAPPLPFEWNGEAMVPLHARRADKAYVVGERYMLAPFEQRSASSHNHQFAWLHEAWLSLPERMAERFPSPEHLRKFALIQAGYSNQQSLVCESEEAAMRVAAFIRPQDEFAIVTVNGPVVNHFTAKSQSLRAMGKEDFQKSKTAIMDVVARMLGVSADDLRRAA